MWNLPDKRDESHLNGNGSDSTGMLEMPPQKYEHECDVSPQRVLNEGALASRPCTVKYGVG